jgi:hypothetical protein
MLEASPPKLQWVYKGTTVDANGVQSKWAGRFQDASGTPADVAQMNIDIQSGLPRLIEGFGGLSNGQSYTSADFIDLNTFKVLLDSRGLLRWQQCSDTTVRPSWQVGIYGNAGHELLVQTQSWGMPTTQKVPQDQFNSSSDFSCDSQWEKTALSTTLAQSHQCLFAWNVMLLNQMKVLVQSM